MMKYRSPVSTSQSSALTDPHLRDTVIRGSLFLFGEMFWPFVAISVFAIVQAIRFGLSEFDYLWLILGSVAAIGGGALYSLDIRMSAEGTKGGAWRRLVAPVGLLTYIFILYLFLYRGLWSLASLMNGFSYRPILRAIVFAGLSLYALKKFHQLTEMERMLKRQSQ